MCRDNPHDVLNYAPPTGATFECIRKNVGASPYAIQCRPYGTRHSRSFLLDIHSFDLTTKQIRRPTRY